MDVSIQVRGGCWAEAREEMREWNEEQMSLAKKGVSGGSDDFSSSSSAAAVHHREDPLAVVGDLVSTLNTSKRYREITLALRSGIRDAAAEFSFLRIRGLRSLLKALYSIAQNEAAIPLFRSSQSIPQLQVVPVLFLNTLKKPKDYPMASLDHILGVEPMKICSPATDAEVALSLRVLEGCCLLHQGSKNLAHKHSAIKVLLNLLSTRRILEQSVCLDALLSLLLDFPANQLEFEACHGIDKIAELIKEEQVDESIRLKCVEFLLLLIGHVNGREKPPFATIHDDVRQLLGEKCASLVWAASQFGSTLDPEQRETALRIQAGRVLEALELY